jgi:5-methylcytosine-specific restriction endonuclease McrA
VLRRADNVQIQFTPSMFSSKGWLTMTVGKTQSYRISKLEKSAVEQLLALQQRQPVLIARIQLRWYWRYQDRFFVADEDLDAQAVYALLESRRRRSQQQIDRAQQTVVAAHQPNTSRRKTIPDDVKQLVWLRDGARCTHCGSTTELQFDHVIPVALGGSDDPANLQILCGPCNRRKSASITIR